MPWTVSKCGKCPASKPWCVVRDSNGAVEGCHPTKAKAEAQQRALYAQERVATTHNALVRRVVATAERRHEAALAASYEAVFLQLTREATRAFRQNAAFVAAGGPPSDWTPVTPDEILALETALRRVGRAGTQARRAVFRDVGGAIAAEYAISFDVTNPAIQGVFGQLGRHITAITENWRQTIMGTIDRAYQAGLSIDDTARSILETGTIDSASRATAIARTEMTAATNGAALAATKLVGFKYKTWVTSPGARFPRHELDLGLDGQTVPIDEPFDVNGNAMQWPAEDGPAEEVVNCRCTVIFGDDPEGGDTGHDAAYPLGAEPPPAGMGSLMVGSDAMANEMLAYQQAADAVHTAPLGLEPVQVRMMDDLHGEMSYNETENLLKVRKDALNHRVANLTHEMAHYLDKQAIREVYGNTEEYIAMVKAMRNSKWYEWCQDSGGFLTEGERIYLGSTREMFARAYLQWIAEKTGNAEMLRSLRSFRSFKYAWEEDDFREISKSLDRLFGRLGWLK